MVYTLVFFNAQNEYIKYRLVLISLHKDLLYIMNLSLYNLNKDQTNILKALAITMIVFHNFIHWTNDIGENEMGFAQERIFYLFDVIKSNPSSFFNGIFTYFGFYGVQLFIFISGYGLAKSYAKNELITYKSYIIPKLSKVYSLFLFTLIIFGVVCIHLNGIYGIHVYLQFALNSILFLPIKNYSLDFAFDYIGPWWYFAMVVQLYLIFPFLYRIIKKYKEKGFIVLTIISFILIYGLHPIANRLSIPLFANFVGHLPEFILGIGFAMFSKFKITWRVLVPTIFIFILSNLSRYTFPFSFLSITIILLCIFHSIYTYRNKESTIYRLLFFIGKISMFMFVINAVVRLYTLPYVEGHSPLYILFGSVVHFIIVVIVSYLLSIIYKKIGLMFDYFKGQICQVK